MSKTKNNCILVVEDDQSYADLFKKRLEAANFETVLCADGKEAWQELQKKEPRILIVDLVMPVMDGFDLLKKIKNKKKKDPKWLQKTHISVLTNLGINGYVRKQVLALGANDCFIKANMSLEEMVEHIKKSCK